MSNVIDFNVHALERLADRAMRHGNVFECYALSQLIDGYKEGLWRVTHWESGQPLFEAVMTPEELEHAHGAKDE